METQSIVRTRPDAVTLPVEEELEVIEIPQDDDSTSPSTDITISENKELNEIYASLNAKQILAARLESCGILDTKMIAVRCKVSYQTIVQWRVIPFYKKLVTINHSIADKIGRESRIRTFKSILAPAYSELIRRMQDPDTVENLSLGEVQSLIVRFDKEIRLDTEGIGETGDSEELEEIRRNRVSLMYEQRVAVEKLKNSGNTIEYTNTTTTRKAVVNG